MRCCAVLIPIFLTFLHPLVVAQNLIPDGGFEDLVNPSCDDPTKNIRFSQYWYPLTATPDLFIGNCPVDESGSVFWDKTITPYEGKNFAGLSSRWNSNSTYISEGIATKLSKPLVAGEIYYFEMAILNRGGYQGFDEDISSCNLKPTKHLDLYASKDSIKIINNFANGTASTPAKLVASLDSEPISSVVSGNEWQIVSTCFEATGEEQFLGIIMPLGTFGTLPECASSASSGVFRSFYFHLDQISLSATPNAIERTIEVCENELVTVNLVELLDEDLIKDATFLWEDGSQAVERTIGQMSEYRIQVITECGVLPIILTILPLKCDPDIYIPTAFSPNDDGINDFFVPQIGISGTLLEYKFSIFNRWGGIVFESSNPDLAWNGRHKNTNISKGTYLWTLYYRIETLNGIQTFKKSGNVLLVR